jgi:septum formation inhibitor MinC
VMVEVRLALEVIRLRAEVANLTRKRDALTMHMNQVHDTLGGTDTVLTLEAAQHVVFERDALKTQLAAERMSLLAMELSRDKRLERARSTIALFASVIKSGEPWTTSCEEALTAAFTQEDA